MANGMCRLWVKDNENGCVHEVGTDKHDSLWVGSDGIVRYYNMQNGEGTECGGYSFVPCDAGVREDGSF